jgi:succinyl-CoA synthetase beta subunit
VGGRGKAGGVKLANTPDEAERVAGQILGMNIKGLTVRKVLVDEAADIKQEIYLGIVLDRVQRRAIMMASAAGGMDIEEVARDAAGIFRRGGDFASGNRNTVFGKQLLRLIFV